MPRTSQLQIRVQHTRGAFSLALAFSTFKLIIPNKLRYFQVIVNGVFSSEKKEMEKLKKKSIHIYIFPA